MRTSVRANQTLNETDDTTGIGRETKRRGLVAVQVAAMMVLVFGCAALTIDVAHLYVVRAELQRSADAGALAGASVFADDSLGPDLYGINPDSAAVTAAGSTRAVELAAQNTVRGTAPALASGDVVWGWYDFENPALPLTTGGQVNAVRVNAGFTSTSLNGPVTNFFANVLGVPTSDVSTTSSAAFDDRFAAYRPLNPGVLIPFTLETNELQTQLSNGPDNFSYDPDLGVVQPFSDGVREIDIYPYRNASGNFGILNVATGNQGNPALVAQILNGITPDELEIETGSSEMTFVDDEGQPLTYQITGEPGIRASLESTVEQRIGDVVGFFVYSTVSDGGSNATYTIVDIRFGLVMEVHLTGNPNNRRIVLQPAVYAGPGVRTGSGAPSSGGLVGRVVIVQ
ncbi:MAG: pilus assembly protein TadG-related protein [Planctomycetota bacterium]|jgi:hypothetical protein